MSENAVSNKKGLHYGWVIVFVGFLSMWFITCIFSSANGMMVIPVSEALGISRSQFSLAATFTSGAGMLMSMSIGKIYKKFTVKKTMLVGSAVFALCYGCMGFAPNIYVFYILSFFSGFAMTGATMMAMSTLVSRWFEEKRGLALALASTGSGVGGVVMNPVIGSLVTAVGWRRTYNILGVVIAVVLIPAVLFLVKEYPSEKGLEPYGKKEGSAPTVIGEEGGYTAAQARLTPMFWLMLPIALFINAICNCVMLHTVAYATDLGFEYSAAAGIASILTACLAIAKIIMGQLFDTLGSRKAGTLSLSIYTLCLVLYFLASKEMPILMYMGVAIFGFGGSFATIAFSVIVQDVFGKKDFATILGSVSVFGAIGGAMGPPLIAAVFDTLGTYKPAWAVLAVIMFISVILLNMVFKAKEKYDSQQA